MNYNASPYLCVGSHYKHEGAHVGKDMNGDAASTLPFIPFTTVDALPRGPNFTALVAQADVIAIPNVRINGPLLFLLFSHRDLAKSLNKQSLRNDRSLFDLPTKGERRAGPLAFAEEYSKPGR